MPNAEQQLQQYINCSAFTWMGRADGVVACVWGLIAPSLLNDNAHLWLVTTDLVDEHKFVFVRHSQKAIANMLKIFPCITGHTDVTNESAVRWLRLLGVRFGEPVNGFMPFEIRAKRNG